MKPNLRMLVATELGPGGDLALAAATSWARRHGGSGVVLHVGRSPDADAAAVLDFRVREVAGDLEGRFERRIEIGKTPDRLLAVAEELGVDLIVLGGRDEGHGRWRFGSVAERIVNHASMPVLVVRAHSASGRVMVISDLSEASSVAISPARAIAAACGTRLLAVHCIEPPQATEASYAGFAVDPAVALREARREAAERLRAIVGEDVDVEVVAGSVIHTVIDAAEAHDVEVVVTASRGRTGVSRWLLGSVAGAIIRDIHRSVLVVRRR